MRMKEFKDFTGLTYAQISKALDLPQSRCEKLYRGVINHKMSDIEAIRKYMRNRGKNIIYVDFTPISKINFKKYLGEVDLDEYRRKKAKERKELDRKIQKSTKSYRGFEFLNEEYYCEEY